MKKTIIHQNLFIIFAIIIVALAIISLQTTQENIRLRQLINNPNSAQQSTVNRYPLIQDYLPEGLVDHTFHYLEDGLEFSFPANLTLTGEDCSGNYQVGSALVKCENFTGTNITMQFLAGTFDPNSNPLDTVASASSTVKKTATTISGRTWNLEWRRGGPGCDGPEPTGCDDLTLYAYTFKGGSAYIFSDHNITSTKDSSAELLKAILVTFKII